MTEPPVGACTCASGSQVCTGHIGTLMTNASEKPQKQPALRVLAAAPGARARGSRSVQVAGRACWCVHTRYRIAASISMLPAIV